MHSIVETRKAVLQNYLNLKSFHDQFREILRGYVHDVYSM